MKMLFQASRWLVPVMLMCSACIQSPEEPGDGITGNDLIVCQIDETPTPLDDLSTKTTLSASHTPLWLSTDAISVFSSDGSASRFALVDGAGTARGTFRGSLPESATYTALYSADAAASMSGGAVRFTQPQTQTAASGDFASGASPMIATFTQASQQPAFKNVFGLLEIRLSGTSKVSKLELESLNTSEMLWGNCALSINGAQGTASQTLTITGGSNKVTLNLGAAAQLSESVAKSFFFALPAGTLGTGFKLDVYDENNNIVSHTVTGSQYDRQSLVRSRIKLMATLSEINRPDDGEIFPEPFTWAAYNNLAREGTADQTVIDPQTSGYPSKEQRPDKFCGMFYFIWHTSWSAPGREPFDNQKILGDHVYGYGTNWNYDGGRACGGYPHHWGRSYLDYYRDDDAWVLRKQAQMLSDAGIDFIVFDATNNSFYETEVLKLLSVWREVRNEGGKTPQIVYMIWHSKGTGVGQAMESYANYNHDVAVTTVYNNIYKAHPEYSDMWFKWEGKPLILAMGEHVTSSTIRNFFTFRRCWYLWNKNWQTDVDANDPWWGNSSEDKWPWGCAYTDNGDNKMKVGTHGGINECVSVSPATHPVSNIGRSFQIGNGWQSYKNHPGNPDYPKAPAKGIYFKQQFAAAKELDPKVIFFTGWNEYLVGHSSGGALQFNYMCGHPVNEYNALFIDQYNHEYSRDIEPIAGDFGDNYYYYLADFIRQFKGVDNIPEYSVYKNISIDGYFTDWNNVSSVYADDKGDTKWRGYDRNNGNGWYGFNSSTVYTNKTGRNDLYKSKIATDGTNLYFYIESVGDFTGITGSEDGLKLLITAGNGSRWEGFSHMLKPTSASTATLYRVNGTTYSWTEVSSSISIAVSGNKLEACIPLSSLGISSSSFSADFKWIDNVDLSHSDGIQRCMRDGDSAPNGRFRYRYVFSR